MLQQCEILGDRIALLDPPWDTAGTAAFGTDPVQGWRGNFESAFGALYFPWVAVPDPLRLAPTRLLPPSGHVAGIIAASDLACGVHKAPANVALAWAQDASVVVDMLAQGGLNMAGINVIRGDSGRPLRLMGARAVSSDPNFRFINLPAARRARSVHALGGVRAEHAAHPRPAVGGDRALPQPALETGRAGRCHGRRCLPGGVQR
jgi:hypothetical protein